MQSAEAITEHCLTFSCRAETLIGILHIPARPRGGVGVLIVVGGPQYRVGSHRQFVLMARVLAANGFPTLRFDYRGMGDSTGAQRPFDQVDEDISTAIDAFMAQDSTLQGVILLGLCDAASAALIYSRRDARVSGLILLNPWARTESGQAQALLRHYYLRRIADRSFWKSLVTGQVKLGAAISGLIDKLRSVAAAGHNLHAEADADFLARMQSGASKFKGRVLLILSGDDLTAREFEQYCAGSASWQRWLSSATVQLVRLQDADHTFSRCADLESASSAICRWLDRAPDSRTAGVGGGVVQ